MNKITKQEIIDNYQLYLFDCEGRVEAVRNFLELECGFGHSKWSTDDFLNLKYLFVKSISEDRTEVHGTNDVWGKRGIVDVFDLLGDIDVCKPINLK